MDLGAIRLTTRAPTEPPINWMTISNICDDRVPGILLAFMEPGNTDSMTMPEGKTIKPRASNPVKMASVLRKNEVKE